MKIIRSYLNKNRNFLFVSLVICLVLIVTTEEKRSKRNSATNSKTKYRAGSEFQKLRRNLNLSKLKLERRDGTTLMTEDEKISLTNLTKRIKRQDDDIKDPLVVYMISIVSHEKEGSTCPYPMTLAKKHGREEIASDLNNNHGGNYVYLCIGRKKFSLIVEQESLISNFHININNEDCGKMMTSIPTDIKTLAIFSSKITFCYGYKEGEKPIQDIRVFIRANGNETVPADCTLEFTNDRFLCLTYADDAPKKIEYSNLNMSRNFSENSNTHENSETNKVTPLGSPIVIGEIHNDNGTGRSDNTIKRQITYTNVKTSAWNIDNKFGAKADITWNISAAAILKFSSTASLDSNLSISNGEITTDTETMQVDYGCLAPAGKYYKCKAIIHRYEVNIDYTIKRTVTYHGGETQSKTISSRFDGISASKMEFERCCYRNCNSPVDNPCPDSNEGTNNEVCPKLEIIVLKEEKSKIGEAIRGDEEAINHSNIQKVTLNDTTFDKNLNPEVIVDLKVIKKASATCPSGYVKVQNSGGEDADFNDAHDVLHSKTYICILKVKLSEAKYQPINTLMINKNTRDCGTLQGAASPVYERGVQTELIPGASIYRIIKGNELTEFFICYGNDPTSGNAPITDIVYLKKGKNINDIASTWNNKYGTILNKKYECAETPINGNKLCFYRDTNVPTSFKIQDFKYDYAKSTKRQVGPPKKVNELTVSSISATTTIKLIKKKEFSHKKVWDLGAMFTFGVNLKAPLVDLNAKTTLSYRRTRVDEKKDAYENAESTTIECASVENKKIKCFSYIIEYKLSIPYKSKIVPYDYKGQIMNGFNTEIEGEYESVESSRIMTSSCCEGDNCCTGTDTQTDKPHCWNTNTNKPFPKDTLCNELEKCFVEEHATSSAHAPSPGKKFRRSNKRRLSKY
jgi:hypothetical protein